MNTSKHEDSFKIKQNLTNELLNEHEKSTPAKQSSSFNKTVSPKNDETDFEKKNASTLQASHNENKDNKDDDLNCRIL